MGKILILLLFIFTLQCFSQNFTDYVDQNYVMTSSLLNQKSLSKTTTATILKEVVIIAKDPGSGCLLQPWFDLLFNAQLPLYYTETTHGNFLYEPTVLKKDATHAFELLTVPTPHTHGSTNMNHVLTEADSIYNFKVLLEYLSNNFALLILSCKEPILLLDRNNKYITKINTYLSGFT